jgi:eukaryotic-like serine/threonine-protein kinase
MGSPPSVPPELPGPGEIVGGKYEIEHVLGAGGMGAVVAARHKTLGQKVAIKFLLPRMTRTDGAHERFLREARASVGIVSQHVARVLDVGTLEKNGAPYIVMEHLEGSDLKQILSERERLDPEVATDWVIQACEAIAEAHQLGIVHRDLKPANLFVARHADGSPLIKVLDFGISKASTGNPDSIPDLTKTDTMLGSPAYMSPEQVKSPKEVDLRTDVWALGVILYEALSGQLPFDAETVPSLSAKICMDSPASLAKLAPKAPPELVRVIERCLEKDPAKRYAGVTELARALLPFAPPSSRAIVDRLGRMTSSADIGMDATVEAPSGAESVDTVKEARSAEKAQTADGWGQTGSQRAGGRTTTVLFAVIAIAAVATLAVYLSRNSKEGAAASATAAVTPPPPMTTSPQAPVATSSVALSARAPDPVPVASASAPPSSTQKPRVTSKVPAISPAKCPTGQIASAGHCCPVGLVWQGSRCDRPLATGF